MKQSEIKLFLDEAWKRYPDGFIPRSAAIKLATELGQEFPKDFLISCKCQKRGMRQLPDRGSYDFESAPVKKVAAKKVASPVVKSEQVEVESAPAAKIQVISDATVNMQGSSAESFVPVKSDQYVRFGYHNDVRDIIKSGIFYPIFITGLSGNGKTFMTEQACAELGRDLFRVNITTETDEDDLFGGFRLINGETVWFDGPVIRAMKIGAVLLLDEVDLASSKIMCLQPVLEGKGVFLKKINTFVQPKAGFTVVATANTKGRGSEDGKYIGTNFLNEAFLERFPITIEQEYPTCSVEKKILGKLFASHSIDNSTFIQNLVNWSESVRKLFYDDGIDEIISTRRLVHIGNAYAIFKDEEKAIDYCINRFDPDVKMAFKALYQKMVDPSGSESNILEPEAPAKDDMYKNYLG